MPRWKKALFSALTLSLFFGLVELILFVAGVKPLLYNEDPYAGFASKIPLFVEQGGKSRGKQLETARNKLGYFNRQQFTKRKIGDTTRIFCLGGSTTYGRPYDDATSFCGWLRELLPLADPTRNWELINAGGISYASYRVAALMEELTTYQPDIFIVYCGQNEFLEQRTYSKIIDTPSPIRGLTVALSRTRLYSGMARIARGPGNQMAGSTSSDQSVGEVHALLDESVGPTDYQRDEALKAEVLTDFRHHMARMITLARNNGARILFVTPASNLRNCSPFKSQHRDGLTAEQQQQWTGLWQEAQRHFTANQFEDALNAVNAAAQVDDQYAHLHYLRGQLLDALERYAEAKAAYQRALDEDVCPLRALSPMRDIVTDLAREHDVPVVDFAELVEKKSPQGIPGEALFLDHVHPTIEGHQMLARSIVEEMAARQWLNLGSNWNDPSIARTAETVMQNVDVKAQAVAMRNLSKVFSWAGKMEDAYSAAQKALALYPGDAESHYQVGSLALHLGETEVAFDRLSYLVGFDLSPGVTFYVKAHGQLASILAERGDYTECERILRKLKVLDPDNAVGQQQWLNLLTLQGKELIKNGKPAEAVSKLREVLRLTPTDVDAKILLAMALVRAGDHPAAVPVLEEIIAGRPNFLTAYDNLSYVLAQLGRLDEAENICRQALEIDPNHDAAQRNLQLILRKQNK